MKILIYGAGNLGSLYAAKLQEAGNDVSILARGHRLQQVREQGIRLQEFQSNQKKTIQVKVVDRLDPQDVYELILVILPRHRVAEVLPTLEQNHNSPSIMFFGNNASGPEEMVNALGPERVLLGFPGAAGVPHQGYIRYLVLDRREQPTTIGELDGEETIRIKEIEDTLLAAGFPTSICPNMDAWLKTHVTEILPTLGALYIANGDINQLKQNRAALVLMIKAIREGQRVLAALGVPLTPANRNSLRWIPNFLLVAIAKWKLADDATTIKIGHAARARDEMKAIARDFSSLVRQSGIETPSINELLTWIDENSQFGMVGKHQPTADAG